MYRGEPKHTTFCVGLAADGEEEWEGICECDKGEVKRLRSCGRNTRDGVQKYVSRACEKGIRIRMPSERTTTTSVIGSCGVVRTTCRKLDWDGESTNNTFAVALYKTGLAESSRSQHKEEVGYLEKNSSYPKMK